MRGLDVIGATTLGPRGRNALVGSGSTAWDNANSYSAGDVVYDRGHYYRALRDISPPFLASVFDGDVPGKSDAWREITQQQANVVGAVDDETQHRNILHSVNNVLKEAAAFVPVLVLLGADVDIDALVERFDSLAPTNRTMWSLWVENGHGAALDQRCATAAQKMLNEAIIPTAELSLHSSVMAFHDRFMKLSDKVTSQPLDDNQSPVWAEVKNYFVDGAKLASLLEGTAAQTVKWSDVKDAAKQAAHGAGDVLDTAKWITYSLIGGAVLLGGGALYAIYKIASGPTGGAVVSRYLGGHR
jgi:hypothetical protein